MNLRHLPAQISSYTGQITWRSAATSYADQQQLYMYLYRYSSEHKKLARAGTFVCAVRQVPQHICEAWSCAANPVSPGHQQPWVHIQEAGQSSRLDSNDNIAVPALHSAGVHATTRPAAPALANLPSCTIPSGLLQHFNCYSQLAEHGATTSTDAGHPGTFIASSTAGQTDRHTPPLLKLTHKAAAQQQTRHTVKKQRQQHFLSRARCPRHPSVAHYSQNNYSDPKSDSPYSQ